MTNISTVGFTLPLLLPLIAITISLGIFYWWQQNKNLITLGRKIPGPPTIPILGNAHLAIGRTANGIYIYIFI